MCAPHLPAPTPIAQGRNRRRSKHTWSLTTTDQLSRPTNIEPLIVAYRNGAPVRLADVATVTDSVEDIRTAGLVQRQARDPAGHLPPAGRKHHRNGRSRSAALVAAAPGADSRRNASWASRGSHDHDSQLRCTMFEFTLLLSIGLVVLVVFVFLRNIRGDADSQRRGSGLADRHVRRDVSCWLQPGQSFADGLTIATGFVVDDAIVVIENITRHLEAGMRPMDAALQGAREIGFRADAPPPPRRAAAGAPSRRGAAASAGSRGRIGHAQGERAQVRRRVDVCRRRQKDRLDPGSPQRASVWVSTRSVLQSTPANSRRGMPPGKRSTASAIR